MEIAIIPCYTDTMKQIYLDNAATSFPKAPGLGKMVAEAIDNSVNINRTESIRAQKEAEDLIDLREMIAAYYGSADPEAIAFTRNVTEALNWAIKGFLKKDDIVLVSSTEHNAVMRPLAEIGARIIRIPSDSRGYNIYDGFEIPKGTKAIIANAASNVTGAIQNLGPLGEIAEKNRLLFFIDAAQSKAGLNDTGATGICFTGHKGLLGPMGTGGLILRKEAAFEIEPLIAGGTGSMSDLISIPDVLPDRLSPGTENIPGLLGLRHALQYKISNNECLEENERIMTEKLYLGLECINGITIHGPGLNEDRTSVISISTGDIDEADAAAALFDEYGIATRVGLHCAPEAHKAISTFPRGTLRFSPGPFTTADEIEITIQAMKEIMNGRLCRYSH